MSSMEDILAERGKQYGSFVTHAQISQKLKHAMSDTGQWSKLADDQKEALSMIMHKIARILNGNPNYHDSWQDIAGYASLVAKRLEDKDE